MAVDALARAIAAGKVPVTAYEMAVKAGYTGTEEQFAEDMGNSGTNAANAAASASAAAASAESVSASTAQIATNTSDISDLKTQIDNIGTPYNVLDWSKAFDKTALSSTDGSASPNDFYWVTDLIEIQNKTYAVSNYNIYKIVYYNENEVIVSATDTLNEKYAAVVNAKYMRVQFAKATLPFDTSDAYILFSSVTEIIDPVKNMKKAEEFYLNASLDDFDKATKEMIYGLNNLIMAAWEEGTINGASGKDAPGSSRFRLVGYIPIEAFYVYENTLNLKTRCFAYDSSFEYLGATGAGMEVNYYNKSDILTTYPACKYVRIVFQTDTLTDVTDNTSIYGTETYYKTTKTYKYMKAITNPSGFEYLGERITINRNRLSYEVYDYFTGYGQDAVVYGDYAFLFKANKVLITKLSTKKNIASRDLPVSAHCNSAVWGNKYNSDDLFPLIYVNAYNAVGVANGVCYVFRVSTETSGAPTGITLVQTITIGFANTEPWTDGNDVRPYGNFFVDTIQNYLWAYTLKDNIDSTRFFKFALPDVSISDVTITNAEILEQFDVEYIPYIQGNTFNDGKLYVVSGYGTEAYKGMLNAINVITNTIVTRVNLYDIGLQFEPEFIDVIDNNLVLGNTTAYKFTF